MLQWMKPLSLIVDLSRSGRVLICLLAAGLLITGCATSDKKKSEADMHMRMGTDHLNRGNYPSALKELLTAQELDPENELIQNNLGLVYFLRGKYELSEKHLGKAVELKPAFSEARNNHGRVLIELGQYERATRELKSVIADLTYGEPAKAWVNLGIAYYRKQDYKAALKSFTQGIEIDRNLCLGQDMYGRSLLELGDLASAARALDNAVVICKPMSFDEPNYFSGLTYYKLGKTSFAIARMEEVLQLNKVNPSGRYAKKAESLLKLMK